MRPSGKGTCERTIRGAAIVAAKVTSNSPSSPIIRATSIQNCFVSTLSGYKVSDRRRAMGSKRDSRQRTIPYEFDRGAEYTPQHEKRGVQFTQVTPTCGIRLDGGLSSQSH